MASFVIHHIAGVKFLELLEKNYSINLGKKDKKQFLLGNLIVDSVKTEMNIPDNLSNEESKKMRNKLSLMIQNEKIATHFRNINDHELVIQSPVLENFINKYSDLLLKDISVLGYLFHLYTDKMFFSDLFKETFECLDKDKNITIFSKDVDIVRIKKNNQEHKLNDFFDFNYPFSIYRDYTIINKILLKYYNILFDSEDLLSNIDGFINPGIEEVDYSKIPDIIRKTASFIKDSYKCEKSDLNVFDEEIIKNFINKVLVGFIDNYGYLLDKLNKVSKSKEVESMYEKIIKRIEQEEKIISIGLFTHKNPDYDAVCSTLTLGNYLKEKFKDKVRIYPILDSFDFNLSINSDLITHKENCDINLDYGIVLDVNEQDLVYGLNLFNKVELKNRFLFDHHTGNRIELEVLDDQKLIFSQSSTCEVLGLDLLQNNAINEFNAYNLYLGITSDTAGFTRQFNDLTKKVIKLLNLDEDVKNNIIIGVTALTPIQKELYDSIKEEKSDLNGLVLYKLELEEEEIDKIKELKNKFIEEKITPKDLGVISILVIKCGNNVFLKIRKNENSEIDIITLAEKLNGGGHSNRCAGRLFNMNYNEALEYILDEYKLLYNNDLNSKGLNRR